MHSTPPHINTRYRFAGYTLTELADIAGQTPAYIYSLAETDKAITRLRAALPENLLLNYSLKANPAAAIVNHVSRQLNGLDVTSRQELITALGTGIHTEDISYSGPGKTSSELRSAISAGCHIHIESSGELQRIHRIASELGKQPCVAIRINPEFNIKQSGMVMGGGPQPFGIDLEQVPVVLQRMHELEIRCEGLHCYAGSQILNADIMMQAQSATLDMMIDIMRQYSLGSNIKLNLGGGFGIPYFPGEQELDIDSVGQSLGEPLNRFHAEFSECTVALELGRYIVGPAGIYISQVVDMKHSRGRHYVIVNGGLNHHLAASGNLGQVIRRNFPIVTNISAVNGETSTVSISGPLCTPLDVLAQDVELPALEPGDTIAITQSGAYGFTASPHKFLGHPEPIEVVL